jgi:uncharacterized protein (TIGR03086 family)
MSTLGPFDAYAAALTRVVDAVPDWDAPSPCAGWSARDVIDHIVDTQREFLTGRGVDVGDRPAGDPAAVWRAHSAVVDRLLSDPVVAESTYDGYFGPTTIGETLSVVYGFDLIVHRWDLATAAGQPAAFSEAEIDTLEQAADGFGEALYSEGICKPAVPVPPGASRQDAVLARLGRSTSLTAAETVST